MLYLYLASFVAGILFGVRLLFFGAERRTLHANTLPLRRSEPAGVAFLVVFGLSGYLFTRYTTTRPVALFGESVLAAAVCAIVATRVAIATARITPEINPDDPRFSLQGHVAVVSAPITVDGEGEIQYGSPAQPQTFRARNLDAGGIATGEEVCIERVENGVAFVERWSQVEERL